MGFMLLFQIMPVLNHARRAPATGFDYSISKWYSAFGPFKFRSSAWRETMKRIALLAAMWALQCLPASAEETPVALDVRKLRAAAAPGNAAVSIAFKSDGFNKRVELAILATGAAQNSPIEKAELLKTDDGRKALRISAGGAEADIVVDPNGFIAVTPGKNAASVEVRVNARYVALPDFFADDVVFDPVHIARPTMTVPAESFLMHFVEGGETIVMCVWPGNLDLPGTKNISPAPLKSADPQVDLIFSGEGEARRTVASRIEFQNKPVYIGILEQKGIWHDEDVRAMAAYKPAPIAWKRPFEARWRGDFLVADGKSMSDWPTRNQTFQFQSTGDARPAEWWKHDTDAMDARFAAVASNKIATKWWERGDENNPQIWQESLASFFIYPAVFKGDEVRLCLYADKSERAKADKATKVARIADKNAPEVTAPNVYERVLIYPLSRTTGTPASVATPVDLMRQTLGAGPCEYVLDLAGVKPRPAGGDRPILSYATCGLWNDHISPILSKLKKNADGSYVPLDEKTKAHLVQALEEMWYFVHAVHDRLREYKKWGTETADLCTQEAQKGTATKPVAEKLLTHLNRLNADMARHKFEGPGSEAYWKERIPELIKLVNEDKYPDVNGISKIRDLGNDQDERVSRCRQYVKGILQEILMLDTSDPSVRAFAADLRDRCHRILRAMHPKEGF
jgi:hypothetical protein